MLSIDDAEGTRDINMGGIAHPARTEEEDWEISRVVLDGSVYHALIELSWVRECDMLPAASTHIGFLTGSSVPVRDGDGGESGNGGGCRPRSVLRITGLVPVRRRIAGLLRGRVEADVGRRESVPSNFVGLFSTYSSLNPLINLCINDGRPVCTTGGGGGGALSCSILSQPYTPPSILQALYSARQLELEEAACFASGTLSGSLLYPSFKHTTLHLTHLHLEQRLECERTSVNTHTSRLVQAINSRVEQLRSAWTSQEQDPTKFDTLITLLIRQELKHRTEVEGSPSKIVSFLDVPFQLSMDMTRQRVRRHSATGYTKGLLKSALLSGSAETCDTVEEDDVPLGEDK